MTKTVALYLRVSTGEQTVENQRRELLAAAERRGWRVVAEFCDNGVSGARGRDKRSGFERAIIQERIAAGIARARAKGTRSGKPFGRPRLSAEREAAVRAALADGAGIRKTARLVGTGNATVARIAAEMSAARLD